MDSVVEHEKLLLFGLATLPDNFMLFEPSKQRLWFSSLKKQINNKKSLQDNDEEFVGVSLSKVQSTQINDEFIKMFNQYFPDSFLVVDVTNSGLFTSEEFSKIATTKEALKNRLMFSENFSYYNFDKVCLANSKLNNWANEINNLTLDGKPLSPLEKFYVAYNYITRFNYNESITDSYDSRNLVNVLNSTNIVCVGYAQMLKALCSRIGINCELQAIGFDKNELNHMNCQVTIKDDKYGVNGTFYSDPCFDSVTNGKASYSHSLISYNDIPKLFVNHWIRFDNKETYNPSSDITNRSDSISEIKKEINSFLLSQKDVFSDYIDKCISDKKSYIITKPATKKDIHNIIDKIIENLLIKVNYGNIKSHFNAFESDLIDKFDMEDLADMILLHSKIKNIAKFKEKIFEEMETYIPQFDSSTFNRLADAFVRYNTAENNEKIKESKLNTTDLSFENFDKLMQNLKKIKGHSEAFNPNDIDKMIITSTVRATKIWGEFRNGNNVFSRLSDLLVVKLRNEGPSSIKSGEDLLNLAREKNKKILAEKQEKQTTPSQENKNESISENENI